MLTAFRRALSAVRSSFADIILTSVHLYRSFLGVFNHFDFKSCFSENGFRFSEIEKSVVKPLAILFEMKIGLTNKRDGDFDGFFIYLEEFNKKTLSIIIKKRLVIEYYLVLKKFRKQITKLS